jgi:Family of unknown function (DUF5906)
VAIGERIMAKKKTGKTGSMRGQIPSLDAYLTRIGAEELNFRRFMVKEYVKGNHYYVEKTLITIDPDRKLVCSRGEHEPTDKERKEIEAALLLATFPHSMAVAERAALIKAADIGGEVYLFRARGGPNSGKVIMLQQKFVNEGGGKVYVPWTFWGDGQWRRMEPEGKLPFWKPNKVGRAHPSGMKMIHEGAKAANYVTELIRDKTRLADHPWGKVLALYEHWGMIGGALAPHRTDYDELRAETPTEVVYACDNDFLGESALQVVSENYRGSMSGIRFGRQFPPSWDMADPMPAGLYAGKRYVGPSLSTLKTPATWATDRVPAGAKAYKNVLRQPFLENWVHSVSPEVFIHVDQPNVMLSAKEFDSTVRPYSHAESTSRIMLASDISKSAIIKYDPSRASGLYGSKEGRFFNTHAKSEIEPETGDPAPFLKFMEHLVPTELDRTVLMRWCATLIARPAAKMAYSVLLISENQGVGKTTLGEHILTPLIGDCNTSFPSEHDIVESQFNHWLAHKRLAVVNEIYAGQSAKAYDKLKTIVTDRAVNVNRKHMPPYTIQNWIHVFACSNSMRALKLDMRDRKWYLPRVTEEKRSHEEWVALYDWLKNGGGLGIIRSWAENFVKEKGHVLEGEEAPPSEIKREIAVEGYSDGQALVAETLEEILGTLTSDHPDDVARRKDWEERGMVDEGRVIVNDRDLQRLITDVVHSGKPSDRLERPLTIRKVARENGWFVGSPRQYRLNGGPLQRVRFITNDVSVALRGLNGLEPLSLDWKKLV